MGPDREPQEETREQAEAVTSESEGEIEVAVPAGEEGGQFTTLRLFVIHCCESFVKNFKVKERRVWTGNMKSFLRAPVGITRTNAPRASFVLI